MKRMDDPARTHGKKRSGKWRTVRRDHLAANPTCIACGGSKKIEVHHCLPFHLHPELELDPANLVSLCEGNPHVNCHLAWGHYYDFSNINPDVKATAAWIMDQYWARKPKK